MSYVIAVVIGNKIYSMHKKIYDNEKMAKNALAVLKKNGKVSERAEVFEVPTWDLQKT